MVQEIPAESDQQRNREPLEWELKEEEDLILNAEEATVLVLSFLQRMGKKIITPRKAVLTDSVFVVDVKLRKAAAVVHINRDTREIVEYTIQPEVKEPMPLPLPPRRILLILAVVTAVIVLTMILTFFKMLNVEDILSIVLNDQFIIGAAVLGIVGIAFILWRRFRG
jgi:hypothetical protein